MSTAERRDLPTLQPLGLAVANALNDTIGTSGLLRRSGCPFLWPTRLLNVQRRRAIYALRAFCRELEEIADSKASRCFKQRLLLNWRSEILLLYDGRPQHAVASALSEAIHLYDLRCEDFLMIIDRRHMDVRNDIQAPSLAELDHYCECAAVAIGRLSLRICGEQTPAGERIAAELGRALQLTNILRDLSKDAARNRLYLPRELLEEHCIFETTPSSVLARPALPDVCRDLALLAEGHYLAAEQAIAACPRRRVRSAAMIFGVYHALFHELLERGWSDLDEPVHIAGWRKLRWRLPWAGRTLRPLRVKSNVAHPRSREGDGWRRSPI